MDRCGLFRACEKRVRQGQGIEFSSLGWQLELCYLVSASAVIDMKVAELGYGQVSVLHS
jgi:hypothetical protein